MDVEVGNKKFVWILVRVVRRPRGGPLNEDRSSSAFVVYSPAKISRTASPERPARRFSWRALSWSE